MIQVSNSILKEAADVLNRVKGDKIYLKSIGEQLYFVSTLYELSVYFNLYTYVDRDINIEVDLGSTVQFNRMIGYFEDDCVDVNIEIGEAELTLFNDTRSLTKLIDQSNLEKPKLEDAITTNTINGIELKEIVDGIGNLKSQDNARLELTGLRLDKDGFIALDGYVLGLYHKELSIEDSFILDANSLTVLKRLLVKYRNEYTIEEYEDDIKISTDGITIYASGKTKATFNYKDLLNNDDDFVIKVETDELSDDIGYLVNSGDYSVSSFDDDKLINKIQEHGKEAEVKTNYELVEGKLEKDYEIHFDNNHFLRVLKVYDTDEITIGYNNVGKFGYSVEPMIIRNGKITSLVLPIRKS